MYIQSMFEDLNKRLLLSDMLPATSYLNGSEFFINIYVCDLPSFEQYIENQTNKFKEMKGYVDDSKNKDLYEWAYGNYNKYNDILKKLTSCTSHFEYLNFELWLRNEYYSLLKEKLEAELIGLYFGEKYDWMLAHYSAFQQSVTNYVRAVAKDPKTKNTSLSMASKYYQQLIESTLIENIKFENSKL